MDKKIKIRIVKKEKSGITLQVKKSVEPIKMGWDEFNANYEIVDHIWAVMNDTMQDKYDKMEKYADQAVVSYFMASAKSAGAHDVLSSYAVLGESIQKIVEIMGCSTMEAMNLVKQKINAIQNSFGAQSRQNHNKRRYAKHAENNTSEVSKKSDDKYPVKSVGTPDQHSFNVLEDNPALLKLKEQLSYS